MKRITKAVLCAFIALIISASGMADPAVTVDVSVLMNAPNLNYAYDGATGTALVTPLVDYAALTVNGVCLYPELKVHNLSAPGCYIQLIALIQTDNAGYSGFTVSVDGATYTGAVDVSLISNSPLGVGTALRAEIPLDAIGVNMAGDMVSGRDVAFTLSGVSGSITITPSAAQKSAIASMLDAYNVSGAWSDRATLDSIAQRSPTSLRGQTNAVTEPESPAPEIAAQTPTYDSNDPLLAPIRDGYVDAWTDEMSSDPLAPVAVTPSPAPRRSADPTDIASLFVSAPAPFAISTPVDLSNVFGPEPPEGYSREAVRKAIQVATTARPAQKPTGDRLYTAVLDALNSSACKATFDYLKIDGNQLESGSKGDAAKGLQQIIVKLGQTVATDGNMGPKTVTALNAAQKSLGLKETAAVDARTFDDLMLYALLFSDPDAAFRILPDQYVGTDDSEPRADITDVNVSGSTISGIVTFNRPLGKIAINCEFATADADFTTADLAYIAPALPNQPYAFSFTIKNDIDIFVLRGTYASTGGWIVREGTKMSYTTVKDAVINRQFTIVAQSDTTEYGRYTVTLN